jgi:CelD/BcsL family acetyltransferase involved in cellulose biosynthesis
LARGADPPTQHQPLEHRPLAGLDAARPSWEQLERRTNNPFASWVFARSWWRNLGEGRPLRLTELRDAEGRPVAILPLFEDRPGPEGIDPCASPTLRFIGHFDADLLGPICAPGDRPRALAALSAIVRGAGVRLIANDLAAGSATALHGQVRQVMPCPVLDLPPGGFDGLLARMSANHRYQLRSRERRLRSEHRVRMRAAGPSTLEEDMETLFALHRARWSGRSPVFEGARATLHHEFAAHALSRGWLRLRLLEVDGRPRAANYALRVGDAEWYWQAGRDPSWNHACVGTVLQTACLRAAIEEGASTYLWLRGCEPYKLRWANRDEPVETVVLEP